MRNSFQSRKNLPLNKMAMPQGHNAETAEVSKTPGQEGTWQATQVYTDLSILHHIVEAH